MPAHDVIISLNLNGAAKSVEVARLRVNDSVILSVIIIKKRIKRILPSPIPSICEKVITAQRMRVNF